MQSGYLLTNDRIIRRLIDIDLRPVRIILGNVGIREDRFYRTLGHTSIAIDTSLSVDIESIRQLMKRLNGTHRGAVGVFTVDTRFGNDVRHLQKSLPGHEGEMAKLKP